MNIDLHGKTAIVTGAAGRVGFAVAQTLVESGAKVAMFDSNERAVESAAEQLSHWGTVRAFVVEPREREMVDLMLRQVHEELGDVSVLVQAPIPPHDQTSGSVDDMVYMMHRVVEHCMDKRGTAIINFPPTTAAADTCAAETASLEWETVWRSQHIRVNVITAENLWTEPALPQNLASLVTFLASNKAEIITGQILRFNGGCA